MATNSRAGSLSDLSYKTGLACWRASSLTGQPASYKQALIPNQRSIAVCNLHNLPALRIFKDPYSLIFPLSQRVSAQPKYDFFTYQLKKVEMHRASQTVHLLAILQKSLDSVLFLYIFLHEVRLSDVRTFITIVQIQKFYKM